MNQNKGFIRSFSLVIICSTLVGCGIPRWEVDKPTGSKGYGIKTFRIESWEANGANCSLYYWDDQMRAHLIWPQLVNHWILDNRNDIALFDGILNRRGQSDKIQQWDHLFAVKGAGPPVDISDEIKLMYIKTSKMPLDSFDNYSFGSFKEEDHKFNINVGKVGSWGLVVVTVQDILSMIHEGKEKGILMKDAKTGQSFYWRDVSAELHK